MGYLLMCFLNFVQLLQAVIGETSSPSRPSPAAAVANEQVESPGGFVPTTSHAEVG